MPEEAGQEIDVHESRDRGTVGGIALQPVHPNATGSPSVSPTRSPSVAQVKVIHDAADSGRLASPTRLFVGFLLVLAAVGLAAVSPEQWRRWVVRIPEVGEDIAVWWAPLAAGGFALLFGGLCLEQRLARYLITAGLFAVTVYCLDMLVGWGLGWRWILAVGAALGYLIHCTPSASLSIPGIFGWAVVAFSCVGCAQGWIDWALIGERLGPSSAAFFHDWGDECRWGTVLVMTAIGVSSSRTRQIHFLNAVLLFGLTYYCFQQGYLRMVEFPELGAGVPALPDPSLENIERWRWVLLGEFALLAIILLHLALGMGALVVAFGATWLMLALHVDREIGRDAIFAYSQAAQLLQTDGDPSTGMTRTLFSGGGPADLPQTGLTMQQKAALLQKAQVRMLATFGWIYLTAILAGIITISGLRMLLRTERLRVWGGFVLWFGFGLSAGWLWTQWPTSTDWDGRLTAWVLPPAHVSAICVVALGITAVLGSWALGKQSRITTWVHAASAAIFIGTVLSLAVLNVQINYGGFSPPPTWFYAVIAGGQSSMMWVLWMHEGFRSRRISPVPTA